jgi:hypothetical protein
METFEVKVLCSGKTRPMAFNPLRVECLVVMDDEDSQDGSLCHVCLASHKVWHAVEPYAEVKAKWDAALAK